MEIAPEADPVEVFRYWISSRQETLRTGDHRLSDAAVACIQSMGRSSRNTSYIGHVRRAMENLQRELGNRYVREFSGEDLREYLFRLPYQPVTLRSRRNYLFGAFAWWEKQGWVNANPMEPVETPQVPEKEPGILTVAETRQLFRTNEKIDPEICGLLALGAFAGMRSSAIARIDYGDIDFAQRGIQTPRHYGAPRRAAEKMNHLRGTLARLTR